MSRVWRVAVTGAQEAGAPGVRSSGEAQPESKSTLRSRLPRVGRSMIPPGGQVGPQSVGWALPENDSSGMRI